MLFVKIVNNEVNQVWDTPPPAGEEGWKSAVEIRPAIIPHRQGYTAHRFDLTTDPVQIIWDAYDISVADRKTGMKAGANFAVQQLLQVGVENLDLDALKAAKDVATAKQAQIDAATSHDELDALM